MSENRFKGPRHSLMVEIVVKLEVKALDILKRGHNLRICVRAALRIGQPVLAQLAAGNDPGNVL